MFESSDWIELRWLLLGYISLWVYTWRFGPLGRPGKPFRSFSYPENARGVVEFAAKSCQLYFSLMMLYLLFFQRWDDGFMWACFLGMTGAGIAYLHMRWWLLRSSPPSQ